MVLQLIVLALGKVSSNSYTDSLSGKQCKVVECGLWCFVLLFFWDFLIDESQFFLVLNLCLLADLQVYICRHLFLYFIH